MIAGLGRLGKTVFLTTHYMDEAQHLADRVAIIAGGRIVAEGRPDELGDRERPPDDDQLPAAERDPARRPAGAAAAARRDQRRAGDRDPGRRSRSSTGSPAGRWSGRSSSTALRVHRPSLEDIYLELTADADGAAEEDGR